MSTKSVTDSRVRMALYRHKTSRPMKELLDLIDGGYTVKAALFKKFFEMAARGHGTDVADVYAKTVEDAFDSCDTTLSVGANAMSELPEARECYRCGELATVVFICPVCDDESCPNCSPDGRCPDCKES